MKSIFQIGNGISNITKLTILSIVLVVSVGILIFFSHTSAPTPVRYSADDLGYNKLYWRHEIARGGAEYAYGEFIKKNNSIPESRQHFFAHAIGEALFQEIGIEGVKVCSDAFSFGCYHGLSTRAIAIRGTEALMKLDAVCKKTFGDLSGCTHGLGHGILEYVGYAKLDSALTMCTELVSQPTPLLGCTSGVFMEYLSPLTDSSGRLEPDSRKIDYSRPYAPCTDVAKEYRSSCYFELGQWFRQTPDADYGALCGALSGEPRRICFLGIGTDLTRGWKDAETLISKCARYDAESELACRAGAAWSLVGNDVAVTLCAYADTESSRTCVDLADLTEGLDESIRQALVRGTAQDEE